MDIEPDTGNPYTCFTCGNTGVVPAPVARHVNDDYAEYAEMANEQDAMAAWERENADLDRWMTEQENIWLASQYAEDSADLDAVHYGKMK